MVLMEAPVHKVDVVTLDHLERRVIPVHLAPLASLDSLEYKVHLDQE